MMALMERINVLNRVTSPHIISHSYVHSCTMSACMRPHTFTWLAPVDPLWGQEHQYPCGFSPMVSCWADIAICLDDSLTWCLFGLATCFHLNQYTARRKDEVDHRGMWPSGACTDLLWHGVHGSTLVAWKRWSLESASPCAMDASFIRPAVRKSEVT